MKERILSGWTFIRVAFIILGGFIIIESVAKEQWIGILPGAYFALCGIFAWGCAGGNCQGNKCYTKAEDKTVETEKINTTVIH